MAVAIEPLNVLSSDTDAHRNDEQNPAGQVLCSTSCRDFRGALRSTSEGPGGKGIKSASLRLGLVPRNVGRGRGRAGSPSINWLILLCSTIRDKPCRLHLYVLTPDCRELIVVAEFRR